MRRSPARLLRSDRATPLFAPSTEGQLRAMISLPVAFLGGLASFVSPCVLPLLPSYLALFAAGSRAASGRRLLNALGFVLGFAAVFVLLGMSATAIGQLLLQHKILLRWLAGLAVIAFGLLLTGILSPAFFARDHHLHWVPKDMTFGSGILVGVAFGFGWTACVTPWLATILVLAAEAAKWQSGAVLLVSYAVGLGIPFLALGLLADRLVVWLKEFARHGALVERIGGGTLVLLGILMVTGVLERLSGLGSFIP